MTWTCETCGEKLGDQFESCWKCANDRVELMPGANGEQVAVVDIPISTTPSLPGYRILDGRGVVTGQSIIAGSLLEDWIAGMTDIFGGRSGVYENRFREAKLTAVSDMAAEAKNKGANGIIGIAFDFESLGKANTMLLVGVSGTAVTAEIE